MDTRGNTPLREMLAAEYTLGTLRGAARRRFERWMRNDAELRALALAWSERLVPLIDDVGTVDPPKRVWDAIEARLPGFAARRGPVAATGWWDRPGLWRGLSAAFATAAVVAIGVALRPGPVVEPRVVRVETVPGAVAPLAAPKSGKPVAVVIASASGDALTIKVAGDVEVGDGKVLQLWMAQRDRKGLLSLGVLPASASGVPIRITPADAATLATVEAFGLSLEPAGGSPQPTRVLGLGALVRVSG